MSAFGKTKWSTYKTRWATYPLMAAIVFANTLSGDAIANPKTKPHPLGDEPAVSSPVGRDTTAPIRFVTINQVLAGERDSHDRGDSVKLAAVGSATTATDSPDPSSTRRRPFSNEPFGLFTFGAPQGLLWTKWRKVQEQIRGEAKVLKTCRTQDCPLSGASRLLAIIDDAQKSTGRARIEVVNRLVNASIRYTSDFVQHGVADLWSPPIATLTSGKGDCEDYAIAKYVALREAGTADADLRLLLVRDRTAGQDHAVLAVRHDGRWLILDNRHEVLNEAADLPQFVPLFALDHHGVKLFQTPRGFESSNLTRPAPTSRTTTMNVRAPGLS
jgi:predicted transglutaminase-like cysteine proteinase